MLKEEIWKTIEEFPKYEVSNWGRVRNLRLHVLSYFVINSEYRVTSLNIGSGQSAKRLLHRLVAAAFCPNPESKPEVNHKDGNKQNNLANNLEWATSVENKQHAKSTGLTVYNHPTRGLKLPPRSPDATQTSGYYGVCWIPSRGKWSARVVFENKVYGQTRKDREEDAARWRDQVVRDNDLPLPLNFN